MPSTLNHLDGMESAPGLGVTVLRPSRTSVGAKWAGFVMAIVGGAYREGDCSRN
jgi:hypothetical protein